MIRYVVIISFLLLFSCRGEQQAPAEAYRPSLHFSAGENWTGEPTGLVCYEGKYHIFYQYNQNGSCFGPISWGHAVSDDLIHWEQLPVAIPFDSTRHAGSGSVVVDEQNTSGFSTTGLSPFIAFYTKKQFRGDEETERIYVSYSLDKGTTWMEHPKPVLESAARSSLQFPKVKWNTRLNRWLMTVSNGNTLSFYSSGNCLDWQYLSTFECPDNSGSWESSDFFPLTDTTTGEEKWVLLISMADGPTGESPATRYFVGDFDGTAFRMTQADWLWTDYGRDHYAAMTFNHLKDSRTILLAWMNCWNYANLLPTESWKGSLCIPRELGLSYENNRSYLLTSSPVQELAFICQKEDTLERSREFSGEYAVIKKEKLTVPFELNLTFDVSRRTLLFAPSEYGVRFKTSLGATLELGYNTQSNYFYINPSALLEKLPAGHLGERVGASYVLKSDTVDWKILIDGNSVEFFGAGGKVALSSLLFADEPFVRVELFSRSGKTQLLSSHIRFY